MTYTHETTLTERHTEYNTNTDALGYSLLVSFTTSVFVGELINSNIIQRLPRVELTNHLSRTLPVHSDYQCPLLEHTTEDHSRDRSTKS